MPPKKSGKPRLTVSEVETLRAWIDAGPAWPDEFAGIMEWKRTEQYAVHDAEDCRVGANAQSQSGQSYHGEAGALEQLAESITNVLK